uniref:Uncharacterized protein n=1 Tax=Oryza punctata TaxID=4537 RepID=A0A0E0JN68_ORYPU
MEKKVIDDDDDAPKPAFVWDGNGPMARRASQKAIAMVYVTAEAAALMFLGTLALISDAAEGLDVDAKTVVGHTVSPAFNLVVHVENPLYFRRRWCANSGEVVVYYSGVALAWGQSAGVLRA